MTVGNAKQIPNKAEIALKKMIPFILGIFEMTKLLIKKPMN